MACKKRPKIKAEPESKRKINNIESPDKYYEKHPSWKFASRDKENWPLTKENMGNKIWDEIIPRMERFETMTWNEIFQINKKKNHSLSDSENWNTKAKKKLAEIKIEREAVLSLSISGKCRLYGYMDEAAFVILWYDDNHGDNSSCVYRSYKKHT